MGAGGTAPGRGGRAGTSASHVQRSTAGSDGSTRIGEAGLGDRPRTPQRLPRATPRAMETLREAATRSSSAGGCEVPGAHSRHAKRLYQFTAIDDCTRVRVLKYDACNQVYGHPVRRMTSAAPTVSGAGRPDGQRRRVPIEVSLARRALDIHHVYIQPRTPRLNGKVERSHRVDDQEFYQLLDRAASPTTSTSSTRSSASGRTTTTTIVPTARSKDIPPSNDYSRRLELMCHRGLETLQKVDGRGEAIALYLRPPSACGSSSWGGGCRDTPGRSGGESGIRTLF